MFSDLATWQLVAVFAVAAVAVWIAGIQLSNTTDAIAHRLKLGEAFGGLVILAVVTNLPELAITVSAALSANLGIAVGNILGGIAIQTVVLALLDGFGMRGADPLTHRAASLPLVVEALALLAILVIVVMGTQLEPHDWHGFELSAALIVVVWMASLWLVGKARRDLPWHDAGSPPSGGQDVPRGHARTTRIERTSAVPFARTVTVFVFASVVTLAGGVALERSGEQIAAHMGMTGVLFGATVLAMATSLPELSTGLASVRMGDFQMAFGDIFGGNAFLPCLFLLAGLISGTAVLPSAHASDIYLTGLGALLTVMYALGLLFRPRRKVAGLGVDSLLVIVLYAAGAAGLVWIGGR